MLRRINGAADEQGACVSIGEATFPSPFSVGLEYAAPARGVWNIVHTGMLVPEAHEIFVCAQGCLRGVVLTAAEMNAAERFSTITVRENDLLDGDMEQLIIDGVADILEKLPKRPPAVLLYTSCIHHFAGCDLPLVYKRLRSRFGEVDFTDCYMNPIMRKSGLTPDQLMRTRMYSLLKERPLCKKAVNLLGNNLPTDKESELVKLVEQNGYKLREITDCNSYAAYQQMAEASYHITYQPAAAVAGEDLANRLHTKHIHLPLSYDYTEIEQSLAKLAAFLQVAPQSYQDEITSCEQALLQAKAVIQNTPIAIDYTLTPRPLSLARLLLTHGFRVERVYLDSIAADEQADFLFLKENYKSLLLYSTTHAKMRFLAEKGEEKLLALGQKAAYFCKTNYFVNIVEGGGLYGFTGIVKLAELMTDAFCHEKDAKSLIQIKGLGCGCCV